MSEPDVLGALRNQDFAELCRQHGVSFAVLFGSVAKKKAVRSSDIDLAVMISSDAMAQGGGAMSDSSSALVRRYAQCNLRRSDWRAGLVHHDSPGGAPALKC